MQYCDIHEYYGHLRTNQQCPGHRDSLRTITKCPVKFSLMTRGKWFSFFKITFSTQYVMRLECIKIALTPLPHLMYYKQHISVY